ITGCGEPRAAMQSRPSPPAELNELAPKLVNAVPLDHLEQPMVVPVVDVNPDDNRTCHSKSLLHDWYNIIGRVDHQPRRAKCLGILDVVDRAEVSPRAAPVLQLLLNGYHIVSAIDPDHVNDVRLEAHGGLEFHRGKEEAAVSGDGKNLLRGADD